MTDEEEDIPAEDAPSEDAEEVQADASMTREKLRETVRQIVDDAVQETVELRGKGRAARRAIARDMGRIQREVSQAIHGAVEGARDGLHAIDLAALKRGLTGRTNTLMTRVRDEDLERMDLLVEAGLFESRSECAAFLMRAGLEARRELVDKVQATAQRIADLKSQLRQELSAEDEA